MDIILYNPISRNGKSILVVESLVKRLKRKNREVRRKSLLDITDIKTFMEESKDAERFIIVGGDGTLNHLVNEIKDLNIKQEVLLYKAGTGNDFARSLRSRKKLIPIKQYLFNLPKVSFNDKERLFLNGVGLGLDGLVCYYVNTSDKKKNKRNYFFHAYRAFKNYKPIKSKIYIDGKEIENEKTWFASVMNSQYFGGGMKIAPKADRDEKDLYLVIIKDVSKFWLLLIFPTIYLGWHTIFKKYVQVYKIKDNVKVSFSEPTYIQIDGETEYNIDEIVVETKK